MEESGAGRRCKDRGCLKCACETVENDVPRVTASSQRPALQGDASRDAEESGPRAGSHFIQEFGHAIEINARGGELESG
jgi:hypothetical protein